MASVYKRGGKGKRGYWYAAWHDQDGKRHWKCTKTTDKSAAERIAAKFEADAALRRDGVIDSTAERFSLEGRRPIAEQIADYKAARSALPGRQAYSDDDNAH